MPRLAILLLVLTGCAATPQQQTSVGFVPVTGKHKIVVMRPDVAVDMLTTGGLLERREDWTLTAQENVIASLTALQARRGSARRVTITRTAPESDDDTTVELIKLHEVVGQSVMLHKFSQAVLPSKEGKFDWTLGDTAVRYGKESGFDYALFLYARDSFSSSGRVALQAVGYLGCMVGVCAVAPGGTQTAFASLVDLKTGKLVWFSYISQKEGDIRTQEGADVLVWSLLDTMSSDSTGGKGS
jgi:hypothetical protein